MISEIAGASRVALFREKLFRTIGVHHRVCPDVQGALHTSGR